MRSISFLSNTALSRILMQLKNLNILSNTIKERKGTKISTTFC